MLIDVQYSPAHNRWSDLRAAVQAAAQDGYDTAWVFDHLDPETLGGDQPMLECMTLAAALTEATAGSGADVGAGSLSIGTLVANVANRHPAMLTAATASIVEMGGGRFRLGLGAGTAPGTAWAAEHERRGIPLLASRADRHRAVVDQLESLARDCPGVPTTVGVNTVELATLAGQHAGGVNVPLNHPRAAEFIEAAVTAAEAAGRGHDFEVSAYVLTTSSPSGPAATVLDRLTITSRWDPDPLPGPGAAELAARLSVQRLILTFLGPVARRA